MGRGARVRACSAQLSSVLGLGLSAKNLESFKPSGQYSEGIKPSDRYSESFKLTGQYSESIKPSDR